MLAKTKRVLLRFYNFVLSVFGPVKNAVFFYYNYFCLPGLKSRTSVTQGLGCDDEVKDDLVRSGFKVVDYRIKIEDYSSYITASNYQKFTSYYGGGAGKNFKEKSLEHYLAADLLVISEKDIFLDVASAGSPVPEIYSDMYGCTAYRQDLSFPYGVYDRTIGGDACRMPVEDGFATKISLHCSFEHFEQDADMGFLREASRVLRKGGRLCIVPLYLAPVYAIKTDPAVWRRGTVSFEDDAVIYCARGWGCRHGRFYDVEHFISRVRNNLSDLRLSLYFVLNEKEIDPGCYVKFVALFEKQ